uniref:Uncharacterized protein n=1 Tax=Spongospora subterranea TaxID=70186 RepID=A0A0H5R9H3_9EUKA|eukprot:CRZ10763.1 hypothetical protein [Spongospora subterranea]
MIVREACLLSSASPKLNTCRMAHIPILWVDVDTIIAAASRQSPSREKLFHDVTTIKRRVRSMAITHRIVELFRRDRDDIHEKLLCRQQLNAGQVPLKHDIDRYHQVMGLAIASLAGVAIRIPWAIVSYLISSTTSSSSDFSDQ